MRRGNPQKCKVKEDDLQSHTVRGGNLQSYAVQESVPRIPPSTGQSIESRVDRWSFEFITLFTLLSVLTVFCSE